LDLRNEVRKDALQFVRERRTLILLFAAPIIVLLILGGVFGRTTAEIGGTIIGMCDLDLSNVSQLFVSGLENNTKITDYSNMSGCDSFVRQEVNEGRLASAVIIPVGFQKNIEEGKSQNITIIIDNSRIQTAPSIEAFMKAAVQETGQQIGTQFILSVWARLDNAQAKLLTLLSDVNSTRNDAFMMKMRLKNTSDSLDSLNFSLLSSQISQANTTLKDALSALSSAESNLSSIQSDFTNYEDELNQTENDLVAINSSLANSTSFIAGLKSGINCSDPLLLAYCIPLDSLNSTLSGAVSSLDSRILKVRQARQDLTEANQTIEHFRSSIESAKNASGSTEQKIADMSEFVSELEENRAHALATISEVSSSLDELINKSYDLELIINDSSSQISQITGRQPESVVSPILLSSERLFGARTFFDFLLPSLIPLILMFVSLFLSSTSLVREKNNGTLPRALLSQVNPFEYCTKKVLSYTIVLIPEVLLLIIIASLMYGAFSLLDIGTTLFVLQTLVLLLIAFISIGVVIAIYSESEATAFLASLVVGLPLLFLSGILFPFEFMPSSIALIGLAFPLTQAVLSMQSVILYNSPQAVGFTILLLYALVFIVIGALSMKRGR